jgi:ParB-like chromosome segregation protein Spo0J
MREAHERRMTEKIRRAAGDGAPQGDANFKRSAPLAPDSTDLQAAPAEDGWGIPDFLNRKLNGITSTGKAALAAIAEATVRTEPAPQPKSWRAPFDPKTGEFADNIRLDGGGDDLAELRESMKQFGWSDQFPALTDENDVVLVGHRRLKVARELEIEPVIKKLSIGQGDAADAERLKLAIVSNTGSKPMTREDRKRIAEYLYGEQEWTMERIAEALNVSARTISTDLDGFEAPSKPPRPKGGRPKGSIGRQPAEDAMARQAEQELQRELALQLINAGFRALAAKLHPDKGGSKEAMVRLNQVRARLRSAS